MGPQEQPQAPQQPAPQPQHQPQPMQMQPPQPSGFGPVPQPVMTQGVPAVPKKGMSKGLLWGIIGGVVALILVIVGLVLALVVFAGPSKEDFRKASEKLNDISKTYNALSGATLVSTYSMTPTIAKNRLEEVQGAKSSIDSAVSELGKMKAINDKEVKDSFNKLNDRMAAFNTSMDTLAEVYGKIMPINIELNDTMDSYSDASDMMSTLTTARKSLEALDLKVEANKTYVAGLVQQIKILEVVIPKKIEMSNDYTKYDSSVNTQYYDAIDELNKLDKDWRSNIEKTLNAGEIKDQINDLNTLLYDKYLGVSK